MVPMTTWGGALRLAPRRSAPGCVVVALQAEIQGTMNRSGMDAKEQSW